MARPKQRKDIRLAPEAREIFIVAESRGLTQRALGEACGLDQDQVSKTKNETREMTAREFINLRDFVGLGEVKSTPAEPPQPWHPNAQTMATLLQAVRPALLAIPSPEEGFGIVAHALSNALRSIARRPATEDNPGAMQMVVDHLIDEVQTGMTELARNEGRT